MTTDTDQQYDAAEDPDTGPATTPAEVEGRTGRDQAGGEGEDAGEPAGGESTSDRG